VALLPPAAFAVHQLRYELAYGARAGTELQKTGHSYLHSVVPWLVLLIGLATGSFLRRIVQAYARRSSPRAFTLSFAAVWALCAGALVVIFFCQETLEGWFAAGHPGGLPAAFGDGGWWAIPVAAGIGLILAAVFHGVCWIVCAVAHRRQRAAVRWGAAPRSRCRVRAARTAIRSPWLGGWSNRGPPRPESAAKLVASF
jgi:hypothetical protein